MIRNMTAYRRHLAKLGAILPPNPAPDARSRARKGGEQGVNGEWYEGGKFLPSKEDRAKQAPLRVARGTKGEVLPSKWEPRPADWLLPVFWLVRAFYDSNHYRRTGKMRISAEIRIAAESPGWQYRSLQELEQACAWINQGILWRYSPDAPENADAPYGDLEDLPPAPVADTREKASEVAVRLARSPKFKKADGTPDTRKIQWFIGKLIEEGKVRNDL